MREERCSSGCSGNSRGLTSAGKRVLYQLLGFCSEFCYFKKVFDPFGCSKSEFHFGFANPTE